MYLKSCLVIATILLAKFSVYSQVLQPGQIATSQTVCVGLPSPFTSLAPASGGTGPISYEWEIAIDLSGPYSLTGITTESLMPFNYGTVSYFLRRGAYTSNDGTVYSNTVSVFRPDLPTLIIAKSEPNGCMGQAFTFSAVSNALTYTWTGPNNFSSNSPTFTISNPQPNHMGTYSCVATGTSGCTGMNSTYFFCILF